MQVRALTIVCFKYGVDQERVLSAVEGEDGWLTAVINNGIAGCPKIRMSPEDVEKAWDAWLRHSAQETELRGTFINVKKNKRKPKGD